MKTFLGNVVYDMDMQSAINAPNWTGQNGIAGLESGTALGATVSAMKSDYGYTSSTIHSVGLTSGLSGIAVKYDHAGKATYLGAADIRRSGGANGY